MGKSKELLLVHLAMEHIELEESVNIMLSPQFYTLKKETLPVKYAYQAKKIAPSLFEGLLDEKSSYEYSVLKEEDGWIFIAYDIEYITTFLASKGIGPEKIAKVYFAQEAVDAFKAPVALSEKEALATLNDTVVVVPRTALGEKSAILPFSQEFTPQKGGINIKGGSVSSLFTQQQAYALAAIFLLFAGIFIVEGLRYSGNHGDNEELKRLYEEYPALESTYTRQGIIEKYRTVDKKERQKRESVKAISNMIFKGVTLNHMEISDKKIKAEFLAKTDEAKKQLKVLAKKAHFNITNSKDSNKLILEGVL